MISMKISDVCNNQGGAALITSLLFMAILSIMGTAAYLTTSNELMISRNYKTAKAAFYSAEAGTEEARERLKGSSSAANYAGDPASGPDQWWSAYILTSSSWQTTDDSNYNSSYKNYIPTSISHTNTTIATNSLQTDISYFVKIRHKREYDAEQAGHTTTSNNYYDSDGSTATHTAASPGNIIYYGYGNPATPTTATQFTTAGSTEHKPVETITAYGSSGNSSKLIEIEVVHNPGPKIKAALYAKGDITGNGTSLSVDGNDNCGAASGKPPVYTLDPSVTNLNGSPTMSGNPASPQNGTDDIDITGYVNSLKDSVTEIITSDQNGTNYGDASNFVTCYSDTSNPHNVGGLKLQNVTGYGLLLVEGDLTLGGGFNWNGLILVTGVLVFNGGGSGINILGAVLANQTIDINGGVDVRYDSCMIDDTLNNTALNIISWKQA